MASLLIYLIFFTIGWLFYFWYKERIKKEAYNNAKYLQNKLREWDWLYDNTEINQMMDEINKMEIKVEPAETAQPVKQPSPADILIKEAQEWRN